MKKNVFATMDLNLLRVFAMLMIEGNVTRAAEKLCLTQSAVSNALNRLRNTIDDPLFERTMHGIKPSAVARDLWQRLAPHYRAIEQELNPNAIDPAQLEGSFSVSMSDYTCARVMPRLGLYLQTHAMGVHIHTAPYSPLNLDHQLEREGIDLALGTNLDATRQSNDLRTQALWPIHFTCFMRRGHPLAAGAFSLDRFLNARHVDVMLPGMTSALYDTLLAEHGHRRNLIITLNHYNDVLSLIAGSDYLGVLPSDLSDLSSESANLTTREPPIALPTRYLAMTWHQRDDVRPAHVWLRKTIEELFDSALGASQLPMVAPVTRVGPGALP